MKVKDLEKAKLFKLIDLLYDLRFKVTDSLGFADSQVTAGGVSIDEINSKTLESKLVEGLYFTGEVLDIDGRCGGFNLQWAWSSGYLAGLNALKGISND
jgi:predicted flavoprotein YhiN